MSDKITLIEGKVIGIGGRGSNKLGVALRCLRLSVNKCVVAMLDFNEAARNMKIIDRPNVRPHGWYNKFNKPHGKRNLK